MSYSFVASSSQYLEVQSDLGLGNKTNKSISLWFKANDANTLYALVWLGLSTAPNVFQASIYLDGAANLGTGDQVAGRINDTGSFFNALTTATFSADTWHHAVVTTEYISAQNDMVVTIYLDGGNSGTATDLDWSSSAGDPDRFSVGRAGDSTPTGYLNGKIAEVAAASGLFSSSDLAALYNAGAGAAATSVTLDTATWVAYYPLLADANDDVGTNHLTVYDATLDSNDHPISYSSGPVMPVLSRIMSGGMQELRGL